MSRFSKAIVAFLTSLGTWGATSFADNGVSSVEWFALLGVAVATYAVYAVPNTPPPGEPRDPNVSETVPST